MNVLITGTSSGIGRSTVLKFLDEGHKVYGVDIQPETVQHSNYRHMIGDISDIGTVPIIPEIDILVNNAGVQNSSGNSDININLIGTMEVTEIYLKMHHLKSIVMMCDVSAHNGAEFPKYVASRGGILAYTKNVSKRCAAWGCTCNSISPGGVTTDLNQPVMSNPELWGAIMNITPLKKWASPEEIAEWIYFLSVINRSVTGQDIIIDNGETNNAEFIWSVK